jgi:hypothetical protein
MATIQIPLSKGYFATIDEHRLPLVEGYNWCAIGPYKRSKTVYATAYVPGSGHHGRNVLMHRLIKGLTDPKVKCDHHDGDGLNNTDENLRVANHQQNMCNRGLSQNNTSGFKGVHFLRANQRWQASIRANNKTTHLGYFPTAETAAHAYDAAARKYHGEFARLNFPQHSNIDLKGEIV